MAKLTKRKHLHNVSFLEFFLIWSDIKGWEVPDVHVEIVNWLEHRQGRNAVLQVWRGCGKSTLVGLYIAWKLLVKPEWRFLVLSADDVTAWKMSADAQHIIDMHPLCQGMKGERVWQSSMWSVSGNPDPRNASVMSKGIMGNITSSRADEVLFDDVEVPKNVGSEEMRRQLRMRIDETTHILVPGGQKLFIGTPHHFVSIYPEQISKGANALTIPLFDADNRNAWPERFTPDEVAYRRKECVTEGTWLSQYMLRPVPTSDVRLDPTLIKTFPNEPVIRQANGDLSMWLDVEGETRQIIGASCYWDVSLGKIKSDDSVLALILTDTHGRLYWTLAEALEGNVDKQCNRIAQLVKEHAIPGVIVETNGPGGFVPAILKKHLSTVRCGVTQQFVTSKKSTRILDAFEPALSGGFLYVHDSVMSMSPLGQQMREFSPESRHNKDDYLDAGAGAIHATPIRVGHIDRRPVEWSEWRPYGNDNEVSFELGW